MMDQLGGGDESQQQQKNRLRGTEVAAVVMQQNQQHHPPHQTCPRCNSTNTKFCYYNNYSLAQPRYFCKGCRRYWTQGGTLRNVPVGGGCRKSKRPKVSSVAAAGSGGERGADAVGANQLSQQLLPQPALQRQQSDQSQEMAKQNAAAIGNNSSLVQGIGSSSLVAPLPMISPFYQGFGGGFLSSLAAIQTMNQPPLPPFNPPLDSSGSGRSLDNPSNLSLLQGITLPTSFGSIQTARPPSGDQWQQGLMSNTNPAGPTGPPVSDVRFWSIGSGIGDGGGGGSGSGNTSNHPGPSSSSNQWPDFSGCGGLDDA
ncbi:hypothetical protein Ancab_033857 [Ancistrocladus abbreviatus]